MDYLWRRKHQKNSVFEQVSDSLKDYKWFQFSGIESNPRFETCMCTVEVIKQKYINYVLAIVESSVIDATKFVVDAACF
ncbi:iron-containing alcohol dehydrogenase [Apibacter mensalis]|uniref:iron-containing alcohol dehydrogenase n=1 Tax=Apibacter mensalis TaxID=1586267 RepID=UPI001C86A91B